MQATPSKLHSDINMIKLIFPIGALYPDESGGVSLSVYWKLKGLYASNKYDITVITSTFGVEKERIVSNQWLATDYGRAIYLDIPNRAIFSYRAAIAIIQQFLSEYKQADIIHLASIFNILALLCFFISFFSNKKVVWSPHGSLDDVEFKKKGFLKKTVLLVLRPFIKNVVFHTTSDDETSFAKKRLGADINTVQITNYMVLPQKLDLPKEKYFIYIGRFHHKKGLDNLIKALAMSKPFLQSEFILKVAGDYNNEYGEYVRNLCTELKLNHKVSFLGHKTGDEKQILLAKAYWSFMPSYSENFGIVAAEALAQGTPVVASIYTPWQSLEQYKAGFWINNTPELIAQVINTILSFTFIDYKVYSKNALILIKKELDVYENIDKWNNAYQTIMATNKSKLHVQV